MSNVEDMSKYAIFEKLQSLDLNLLAQISRTRKFNAREIINYENDEIDKIYILLKGFIKVYKINRFDNEVFLYTLKTCGLINTFNFFQKGTYFANAECIEESHILCIDFKSLQKLLKENQFIAIFFYEELIKKVDLLKYVLNREMVYDGTAKVAYMVCNLLDEFNSLRKQDVAYMLNIQPETLSRILTKLKRENMIETGSDGKVTVKDRDKLTTIFTQ